MRDVILRDLLYLPIYMFAFDRRCGMPIIWYYLQVVRDVLILDRVFTSLVCSQEQPLLLVI